MSHLFGRQAGDGRQSYSAVISQSIDLQIV